MGTLLDKIDNLLAIAGIMCLIAAAVAPNQVWTTLITWTGQKRIWTGVLGTIFLSLSLLKYFDGWQPSPTICDVKGLKAGIVAVNGLKQSFDYMYPDVYGGGAPISAGSLAIRRDRVRVAIASAIQQFANLDPPIDNCGGALNSGAAH